MNKPPYQVFPSIFTEKITLRAIYQDDISQLLEISFYEGKKAVNIEEATEMQQKIDQNYRDGDSIHWCIVDNSTNKIVGTCGYYRGFEQDAGELGCILLPKFRAKGFMTAALEAAIHFGLNEMKLNKIWAATSSENEKAIKLLESLNFIKTSDLEDDHIVYKLNTESIG